jgi:O-antigen ligase
LMLLAVATTEGRPWQASRSRWWLVGAVVASMLVSTMASPRSFIAWQRLELYYAIMLLGLSVYLLHRNDLRSTAAPYWLAIALVQAAILAEVALWLLHLQGPASDVTHHVPYHANVRHFGYLGFLGAATGAALGARWPRAAVTGLLLCTAALIGIVQLGSRGALLSWVVFVLIAGCVVARPWRVRLLVVGLLATAFALAAAWWLAQSNLLGAGSLVERAQHGELSGASGRLALWSDVVSGIAKRPWWGYGPDGRSFLSCCGTYGPYVARTVQPHNVLLQLLEEFGLIGTLLMSALAIDVIRRTTSIRQWRTLMRNDSDAGLLLAILLGLLAFGLVDGPFYYPVPLLLAAVLAALLLARRHAFAASVDS